MDTKEATDLGKSEPLMVRMRLSIWPIHQIFVASGMAFCLAAMIGYFAYQSQVNHGLLDIDDAPPLTAEFKVDINSANLGEIVVLPGLGPRLASAIIDHRETNGPFQTFESLQTVSGIGPKKVQALKPFLLPLDDSQ